MTPTELKKVSVSGGTPLTIAEVNYCRGASWGPDDRIIYTPDQQSGLYRIPAAGGEPEELTTLDTEKGEVTHRWPHILPGGKAVLFVSHTQSSQFEEGVIEALDLESGERKVLVRGGTYPRWANSGHLLYVREGTLYAVPMDPVRLEVQGSPGPVIEGLTTNERAYGTAHYSVSDTGKLVYMRGSVTAGVYSIVQVDRQGQATQLVEDLQNYWNPVFSPDGRRLAIDISDAGGNGDIWVADLERGIHTRLTFDPGDDTRPVWSPDGEWIYFQSDRGQSDDIFRVAADGSEQPVRLTENELDLQPTSVSPDGRVLVYTQDSAETGGDIWMMPLDGDGEPGLFLSTPFNEYGGRVSPDGRWLAYGSNESGSWEVYVRPFPSGRGEWQISNGNRATYPAWSPKGDEIFFRTFGGISVVSVDTSGDSFGAKRPETLFEGDFVDLYPTWDYNVAPDAQSFVMFQGSDSQDKVDHVVLVTNWFTELERTFAGPDR